MREQKIHQLAVSVVGKMKVRDVEGTTGSCYAFSPRLPTGRAGLAQTAVVLIEYEVLTFGALGDHPLPWDLVFQLVGLVWPRPPQS